MCRLPSGSVRSPAAMRLDRAMIIICWPVSVTAR
jgi:hypothetical protein